MYKVCFISIQNSVNEKFYNKTFFTTSVFLNIIPYLHLQRCLPLLPIWSKCSLIQKPVQWFAEKIIRNNYCLKELIRNELSSEKYFSKLKQIEIKQHCHFNFYLNIQFSKKLIFTSLVEPIKSLIILFTCNMFPQKLIHTVILTKALVQT